MPFCSPALKDTLSLIVQQSEALETHAERWQESVLAAMGARRDEGRTEDEGLSQPAAPWVSGGQPSLSAAAGREGSVAGKTLKLANAAHEALLL